MIAWSSFINFVQSPRRTLIALLFLWAIAQVVAFLYFGVKSSVDTVLYVDDAQLLLQGALPAQYILHTSYSFLIAVVLFLGGRPEHVVIFHLLFSALAVAAVYRLTLSLSSDGTTAAIATLLYVLWPDIQQWNYIVYTDSIFTSSVLIAIALIHFARTRLEYVLAGIGAVFAIFARPVGITFFTALLVYGVVWFSQSGFKRRRALYAISFVLIAIGLIAVNQAVDEYIDGFLDSYAKAEIIYPGIPVGVDPPKDLYSPGYEYPALVRLALFIVNNPVFFMKISLVKTFLFLGHVKPYFSWTHNILIALFLWPLYVFGVVGIRSLPNNGLKAFIFSFIALQTLTITLTSENWDGRFLLPVLPWVFILSANGILVLLRRRLSKIEG
jgi:hypothetical protein